MYLHWLVVAVLVLSALPTWYVLIVNLGDWLVWFSDPVV